MKGCGVFKETFIVSSGEVRVGMMDISPTTKYAYILLSRTCDYVTLGSKRNFAGVIKSRILRRGGDPGFSRWAQCNHQGSLYREVERSESQREEVTAGAEAKGEKRCHPAGFEDGVRGHEPRNAGNL